MTNKIICGDSLKILKTLPKAKMIFADPPDNLCVAYDRFDDNQEPARYRAWLISILFAMDKRGAIGWLSYYHKYQPFIFAACAETTIFRQFIWRFTFGQHNDFDCGNGYRPIMRVMRLGAKLYPNAIRISSARQTIYNDKRANPTGRIPDDVWEFPRVCGTFKERRSWCPNQHPEALVERIVKLSTAPGDLVIDMFAGTGTVNRVCKRLGIDCIGIEISKTYCNKIRAELRR